MHRRIRSRPRPSIGPKVFAGLRKALPSVPYWHPQIPSCDEQQPLRDPPHVQVDSRQPSQQRSRVSAGRVSQQTRSGSVAPSPPAPPGSTPVPAVPPVAVPPVVPAAVPPAALELPPSVPVVPPELPEVSPPVPDAAGSPAWLPSAVRAAPDFSQAAQRTRTAITSRAGERR